MASLIHDTSPILRHSLQQSHNKGLHYGFRDAILSRLVTIIKRLVHHAVYCISLSCLLSFLCNPYIRFLIYEIFHLLVIISHNKGLYYGFRDAILSHLVSIHQAPCAS